MAETYTAVGLVATTPRNVVTADGLAITSFRLAAGSRRFDRETGSWVDGDTNWFTVVSFRQLAENANECLAKGDRVVVSGRLKVRDWDNGERTGTAVEIEADSLGHDLLFGTSSFEKVSRKTQQAEDSNSTLQPA
jgi:single-strand DNA-binding protein